MKTVQRIAAAWLVAASMPLPAAQLYQWKDAQGRTVYSDQPPPPSVKGVQQRRFVGSFVESGESYELKQAREKSPVTLYAGSCGAPCDDARRLLQTRGVPFTEIDPSENGEARDALQKLTGRNRVPVLVVGADKIDGFEEGQWHAALDRAHYPKAPAVARKPASAASAPQPAAGAPAKP